MAAFRRGDLQQAQSAFRTALKIDPQYSGALTGLAAIYSAISKFKTARDLRMQAYRASPDDPELMLVYASTLQGEARRSAFAAALARLDPESDNARSLRIRIANDRAVAGRKLSRLVSPYENSTVKLFRIMDGLSHPRGVGVAVQLNGKVTAHLLVDSGASGIAISPRLAEKAGLEVVNREESEVKGIGDEKPQSSIAYIAPQLRIGSVVFADYPISAFRSARSPDEDGLIGPDVLGRFIVRLDFVEHVMSLECRPKNPDADSGEPVDWTGPPAPGFYRIFRFGDHLAVPTLVNDGRSALFLVDSGSSANLIDTEVAREFTKLNNDSRTVVKGIQGKVKEASRANRISLQFAGFRQDNPDVLAISLEKMSDGMGVGFGGILGMPVLEQLAVTIDYREGTIRFEYNKPWSAGVAFRVSDDWPSAPVREVTDRSCLCPPPIAGPAPKPAATREKPPILSWYYKKVVLRIIPPLHGSKLHLTRSDPRIVMANFSQGAQVEHQKFGLGTVMSSTDERIVIKFDDHGEKKFVTPMVIGSLKKSDRQPPAEKRASRARKPKTAAAQAQA